ncbi:MAG: glycerophosphodiester phosphodiesterase family protein, partial [Clostridiaceae bacterium]|nr:glycerophosphodiester phosphodiesterase family protein [Clostridiaceae bacterium]
MDLLNNRNRTFIASHSGMFCGNLVRNTIPAFEAAVKMGADILEVDVAKTKDDRLILFHTGTEKLAFGKDISVQNCTLQELKTMRLKNSSGGKTIYYVDLLDDFLEHFKGRAIINIDRAWDIFEDVAAAVRRHGMVNEVFMKADCSDNHWEKAQAVA